MVIFRIILLIIVIAVIVWLVYWLFFRTKKKASSKMTNVETTLQTFNTRFNMLLKALNERQRTPEVIAAEIDQMFDEFQKDKTVEFQTTLKRIEKSKKDLEDNEIELNNNIIRAKNQIEVLKIKYKETQDEEIAKIGAGLKANITTSQKTLQQIATNKGQLERSKNLVEQKLQTFKTNLVAKRAEVALLITQYNVNGTLNINSSIFMDDLIKEFEDKSAEVTIDMHVEDVMRGKSDNSDLLDPSLIDEFKKECQ